MPAMRHLFSFLCVSRMMRGPASGGVCDMAIPSCHKAKDQWRQDKHLRDRYESYVEPGHAWHARSIGPALEDMHRHPLDGHAKYQPHQQHHDGALDPWAQKPVWLPEDDTATGNDAEHHESIAQACHEAVPQRRTDILQPNVERGLRQFPEIIGKDRPDKDDHHCATELPPVRPSGYLAPSRLSPHCCLPPSGVRRS